MLKLPTKPVEAELNSPKTLIVFGKPKIGKTTSVAGLPNCLVINFEDPEQTTTGMIHYMQDVSEKNMSELEEAIKEMGYPYDTIALDTVTKLEELCKKEAELLYSQTPMGKGWFKRTEDGKLSKESGKYKYKDLLFLPNGAGYPYMTKAFFKVIERFKKLAPNIIFIAHNKDTMLNKDGVEFSSMDINLTGKNKQLLSQMAHAIGYMTRRSGKNYIEFLPTDDVLAGCKVRRLDSKEFLISEYDDKGKLKTYWEEIFINNKNK